MFRAFRGKNLAAEAKETMKSERNSGIMSRRAYRSADLESIRKILDGPRRTDAERRKGRRFCEKQMLVILIFILLGDSFKYGHLLGLSRYNWIQGHFADIGLPAQCTTALYHLFGHTRLGRFVAAVLPPVAFILYEFWQIPNADPADVVCYAAGSAAASISISLFLAQDKRKRMVAFVRRLSGRR